LPCELASQIELLKVGHDIPEVIKKCIDSINPYQLKSTGGGANYVPEVLQKAASWVKAEAAALLKPVSHVSS
jgi:hypothetical protein